MAMCRFSVEDILAALRAFKEDTIRSKLKKGDIDMIYKISELLADVLEEDQTEDLHLPGRDGWLYPVNELCLNDCDWLEESDTMHFLHDKFSAHLAQVFRVKTKRDHDEVSGDNNSILFCSTLFYSRLCPSTTGRSTPPESSNFLCPLLSLSIPLPVALQCHFQTTF